MVTETAPKPGPAAEGDAIEAWNPAEPGVADYLRAVTTCVDLFVLQTVRDAHLSVADRLFGVASAVTGRPTGAYRGVHRSLAEMCYATVDRGISGVCDAAFVLESARARRVPAVRGGGLWRTGLNALIGDHLARTQSRLTIEMSVRVDGRDVGSTRPALAEAFPSAGGKVAVFLHGMGEYEAHWAAFRQEVGGTYAETLARHGWTPVFVRYNTGLSLLENGRALERLLGSLTSAWPAPVSRIAIIGHSMGGLVARAGCDLLAGEPSGGALVTDVVTLGTPHLGADLARVVEITARHLALTPETRPYARMLDARSIGIHDLARGLPTTPGSGHIRYRLVTGSLPKPWDTLLGDSMVRRASGTATRRRTSLLPEADILHVEGASHLGLLNRPEVHVALEAWLGSPGSSVAEPDLTGVP